MSATDQVFGSWDPALAFFTGVPGWGELLIVLVLIVLLFGNRLPSVMRSLGQGIMEFKRGIRDDKTESARIEDSDRVP